MGKRYRLSAAAVMVVKEIVIIQLQKRRGQLACDATRTD